MVIYPYFKPLPIGGGNWQWPSPAWWSASLSITWLSNHVIGFFMPFCLSKSNLRYMHSINGPVSPFCKQGRIQDQCKFTEQFLHYPLRERKLWQTYCHNSMRKSIKTLFYIIRLLELYFRQRRSGTSYATIKSRRRIWR